ncbi:MAG: hypothetical protein ABIH23_28370 [bacterium]
MNTATQTFLKTAVFVLLITVPCAQSAPLDLTKDTVSFQLNDLTIGLDKQTGSIVQMSYPPAGMMLEAEPEHASMVDIAYPIEEFNALRLASRFSSEAQITNENDAVTIAWTKLGASRELNIPGTVSATVILKSADDGHSIIMTCAISNQSEKPIPQILFPDFWGLLPFAGEDQTCIRMAGSREADPINPFQALQRKPDSVSFYARNPSVAGQEYSTGSAYDPSWTRWLDFGGITAGFSLFPKRWGWDPQTKIRLYRSEIDGKVRLSHVHYIDVAPGATWTSGEFWLTPHKHGWAEGIEPYREYVKQNVKREYSVPRHIREGLGYRTIFMMNGGTPNTKEDIVYRLSDLPNVAKEAKAHGLDELVPWFWTDSFQLPMTTLPILGSDKEFVDAILQCKEIGVNVSPFISIFVLSNPTAARFGLTPKTKSGWTYHLDMIPTFNPPYASAQATEYIDPSNQGVARRSLPKLENIY